jgi:hypothetical protein
MTVFDVLVFAVPTFAAINRFRGGGVVALPGETPTNARSQVRRLTFLAAVAAFVWWGDGWFAALVVTLALLAGLLTGWGVPQGAAGGYNSAPLEEFLPLDWATTRLLALTNNAGDARLWGVVWLTLWGLLVGLAPAFAMASAWPLLWASMGVIYWATGNWMKHTTGNAGDGREVAEWIFGGLLGGTLALSMAF